MNKWNRTYFAGHYISDDNKWTATLVKAGYNKELGVKLTRHYSVKRKGAHDSTAVQCLTLDEAKEKINGGRI